MLWIYINYLGKIKEEKKKKEKSNIKDYVVRQCAYILRSEWLSIHYKKI